jgi:mannonate dehydratase
MSIRIALCQVPDVTEDLAAFGRQFGVGSINISFPNLPFDRGYWEISDLVDLKRRCQDLGLTLEVIENVPHEALEDIVLGRPGRDQRLDNLCTLIRNMASAEIPMLGYHFMANGVWRTNMNAPARGGATASAYDDALVQDGNRTGWPLHPGGVWSGDVNDLILSEEQIWANYQYFLDAVLPVADEVGLELAQHPDDPPVRQIDGYARVFRSPAGYKRAMEMLKESKAWGINLCLGTVSEMYGAESVHEMIEHFGPLGKIRYVHLRDVKGTVPSFVECFLGEGNYDPYEVIMHLKRVGFKGWLQDDHVPSTVGDTGYSHRARAHEIGYMQGILSSIR